MFWTSVILIILHVTTISTSFKSRTAKTWMQKSIRCPASSTLALGIDFGTSGARINIIDENDQVLVDNRILYQENEMQSHNLWIQSLESLLATIPFNISSQITAISCCGTSASCLIVDTSVGSISRSVRMYDYSVVSSLNPSGSKSLAAIKQFAPAGSSTLSATSTLAKLLAWNYETTFKSTDKLAHQSDYVLSYLRHGSASHRNNFISDWHNALKLGFDVQDLKYPEWLISLLDNEGIDSSILPRVVEPGTSIGPVSDELQKRFGFSATCKVVSGTTDSIAAFIATGASKPGEAVTSLGSTTVLKLISDSRVDDSSRGIYSHRLMSGNLNNQSSTLWLVGGASNVGCSIFRREGFSNDDLEDLSKDIDSSTDSPLDYYPLTKPGERFPTNDPLKEPCLEPKPFESDSRSNRRDYLKGLLQGIARVERDGYSALSELGASKLTKVVTAGGGSKNPTWTAMRRRILGVETVKAANIEAAFGAAKLARYCLY